MKNNNPQKCNNNKNQKELRRRKNFRQDTQILHKYMVANPYSIPSLGLLKNSDLFPISYNAYLVVWIFYPKNKLNRTFSLHQSLG